MGKRSEFERVEKDFYRTIDNRSVKPLLPFIYGLKYAEPCVGSGDLVKMLEGYAKCVVGSDISTGTDALTLEADYFKDADCVITNPPWSRNLLHPMIEHFSKHKPTWLLFDADWAHTKQSSEYMKYCTHIVSVGRLIWIEGTKTSGKDNCAWYRFDINKNEPTQFVGR